MRFILVTVLVLVFGLQIKAQSAFEEVEGMVTFISSQHTYVKYASTEGIFTGDTLYSATNHQPILIVKNLSSTSVVCTPFPSISLKINDKIIAKRIIPTKKLQQNKAIKKDTLFSTTDTTLQNIDEKSKASTQKQIVNGRFGISGYSGFSNTPVHNSTVLNYGLSLNILNIADSKFSLESNILFRHEQGEWSNVQQNIFNGLKIYHLALKYDWKDHSYVSFGRSINPNISSIGAIDGLQVEKTFKNIFTGGFIGSRPDYMDYGFNFNLLQYGLYVGHVMQHPKRNMRNSIAIVEQNNHSKTDRRFLYFQHSSSFIKNVFVFYSLELDLYKVVNEQKQNTVSLTSTYLSLRYRPFKKLTLSATYDSRKNAIYYETDKLFLSSLIESEARQGLSLQGNYTIFKNLYTGARVGYRFQKKDARPAKNAYWFITHGNLFKSEISATLSATVLETIYLNGNVYAIRFSRGFLSGKMYLSGGYSFVNYKILHAELPLKQHIADVNISAEIIPKVNFSLNFESDFERQNKFYRLSFQLRKRF